MSLMVTTGPGLWEAHKSMYEWCRSRRRCWGRGEVSKEEGQESLDRATDYRTEHFNVTGSKRAQLYSEQSTRVPLWKKENTNSPLYSGYQQLPSHT